MWCIHLIRCLLISSLVSLSSGALYTSPSQLPKTVYDYIVIGAGTAGNVVANRLTEDPEISVLVLEAGVSNEGVTASIVPLLGPTLVPNSLYDWNYTTTPQSGYNGRVIQFPRGRMLGGSSSVNYMVYTHGSKEDFDRYAAVTGDEGWAWNNLQKYIQRNEKFVAPADHHNTSGEFIPSVHGFHGAVSVSLPGFPTPVDQRVINTTIEQAAEFPFNQDMNSGNVLGIGWTQATIGDGQRSSSATAYLAPNYLSRPNLHVLIHAQVTKLLRTGTTRGIPSFHSVQFAAGPGATLTTVTATKEIILSAGAVGTPQILQLSGIGDKLDLDSLGIPTIVNNPSVGRNLSDHPFVPGPYLVRGNGSFDGIFRDQNLLDADLMQWNQTHSGPLAAGLTNLLGWLRLPANSSIFDTVPDPAAGPNSSHWEMIFANLWVVPGVLAPPTGSFMSVAANLISPTSRGVIKLASSNPFDKPLIDPAYLTTEFDIFALREAIKAVQRFVAGNAWNDYIIGPFGDFANATTDTTIEQYVRNHATTVFHPVGTASMSPKGAEWGVVGPDLRVKGVEGLRIADGSILPFIPNAHTQSPIYLVGERAADLIKGVC